jgi:hypothetical protein
VSGEGIVEPTYSQLIRRQYESNGGDSTRLFRTILSISQTVPMDEALACLEQCVIEKRLAWLDKHMDALTKTGNPILDGYMAFYESYLGLSIPRDGKIVEATAERMVIRWWNHCPTLEACRKLGLDTRQICRKVYQQPVQVFLAKLDPGLRFGRNYEALRPYTPYCEEIISLEK